MKLDKIQTCDCYTAKIMQSYFTFNYYYRWFLDGRLIQGKHTKQFRIDKIDHTYNDKILKCEVINSIGKTEDTETLNVHCE